MNILCTNFPQKLIETLNELSEKNNFFLSFYKNPQIYFDCECIFLPSCNTIKNKQNKRKIILGTQEQLTQIQNSLHVQEETYIQIPCDPLQILFYLLEISNEKKQEKILSYQEIFFHIGMNRVEKASQEIPMGKMTKRLLKIFLEEPETIISPLQIQQKLWSDIYPENTSRNLRSNIQKLKQILKQHGCDYILNIRGEGYKIKKICCNS